MSGGDGSKKYEYFQLAKNLADSIKNVVALSIKKQGTVSMPIEKHSKAGIRMVPVNGIAIRFAGIELIVTLLKKYNEKGMTAVEAIADEAIIFMK